MSKYQGSQMSTDVRQVKDLTPRPPMPPGFSSYDEWEGFKSNIQRAFTNGLIPRAIDTAEKALVIALKGRELGLEPLYALSVLYLVNGMPALEGEVMLALVLERYPKAHVKWIEQTAKKATVEMGRPDGEKSQFSFSIEEAFQAGLILRIEKTGQVIPHPRKEVWAKYTADMLTWRAVARAVRRLFPECIMGCVTPDEAIGVEPISTVSAKEIDAEFAPQAPEALPAAEVKAEVIAPKVVEAVPLDALFTEKEPEKKPEPRNVFKVQDPPQTQATGQNYKFPAGQFFGKRPCDLPKAQLTGYLGQLKRRDAATNGTDAQVKEMIREVEKVLG